MQKTVRFTTLKLNQMFGLVYLTLAINFSLLLKLKNSSGTFCQLFFSINAIFKCRVAIVTTRISDYKYSILRKVITLNYFQKPILQHRNNKKLL